MPQPFWEIELAKQHGKLINSALDYSPESRTAPVFSTQPVMPSRMASGWQPPPVVRPAQTYAPASRSAPIVFSHPPGAPQSGRRTAPPAWQHPGTMRRPVARTAPYAAGDADASDGLLLALGARLKSLQHPPGWLAGVLVAVAGFLGNQLRHSQPPSVPAGAVNHSSVQSQAKRSPTIGLVARCARPADREWIDPRCKRRGL